MKELLIPLNEYSPKYKQVYQSIRSLIEKGDLKKDAKLPSIRRLADTLQVSRNTTLIAYEQLLAEGYIRSEQKKGYFVESISPFDLHSVHVTEIKEREKVQDIVIDFRAGTVDQHAFPLKAWRQCSNEVLKEEISFTYGDRQGDPLLREKIANYLLQSRGIRTSPNSIVIGSSTQQLLMHLSLLLKSDHTSIAVENPGYDGARIIFQMNGYQLEPVQVTEKGLSLDQLNQVDSKLVYITPSHQFPTGVTLPIPERQQLLQWAEQQNGYIIEDDYDSEFRYKQNPIPALSSLQQEARVVYLGTFSKAFLPSIRLSYMVLPTILLSQYKHLFQDVEQTASGLHQRTMARFMELGHWDSHIRKMRAVYKRKMQHLVQTLQKVFDDRIEIMGSQSGIYLLIQVKSPSSEANLIKQAQVLGVKVYPTSHYFAGKYPDEPILQLGFSNLSMDQISLGVQLLAQAWDLEK